MARSALLLQLQLRLLVAPCSTFGVPRGRDGHDAGGRGRQHLQPGVRAAVRRAHDAHAAAAAALGPALRGAGLGLWRRVRRGRHGRAARRREPAGGGAGAGQRAALRGRLHAAQARDGLQHARGRGRGRRAAARRLGRRDGLARGRGAAAAGLRALRVAVPALLRAGLDAAQGLRARRPRHGAESAILVPAGSSLVPLTARGQT